MGKQTMGLHRIDLRTALTGLVERMDDGTGAARTLAKVVVAAELRALAQQLESATIEKRAN